jgi:hypothetical protein
MKIYDISCNTSCGTSSNSQNTNSCTETSESTLNIGVTYPGVVHPLLPITASTTNSIIGFNILGVNRIVPNCSSNPVEISSNVNICGDLSVLDDTVVHDISANMIRFWNNSHFFNWGVHIIPISGAEFTLGMDGISTTDKDVTNDTHNHANDTLAGSGTAEAGGDTSEAGAWDHRHTVDVSGTTASSIGGSDGIVYEPWNLNIAGTESELFDNKIIFIQFIAPASGTYTDLDLWSGHVSSSSYKGTIGVGIYTDVAGNPGSPKALVGGGTQSFGSSTDMRRKHITVNFVASATLTKNTKYWVGVAADNASGRVWLGYHAGYAQHHRVVQSQTSGFSSVGGMPTTTHVTNTDENLAFWFRLSGPSEKQTHTHTVDASGITSTVSVGDHSHTFLDDNIAIVTTIAGLTANDTHHHTCLSHPLLDEERVSWTSGWLYPGFGGYAMASQTGNVAWSDRSSYPTDGKGPSDAGHYAYALATSIPFDGWLICDSSGGFGNGIHHGGHCCPGSHIHPAGPSSRFSWMLGKYDNVAVTTFELILEFYLIRCSLSASGAVPEPELIGTSSITNKCGNGTWGSVTSPATTIVINAGDAIGLYIASNTDVLHTPATFSLEVHRKY